MSQTAKELLTALFGALWLISAMLLILTDPLCRLVEWDIRRMNERVGRSRKP